MAHGVTDLRPGPLPSAGTRIVAWALAHSAAIRGLKPTLQLTFSEQHPTKIIRQ